MRTTCAPSSSSNSTWHGVLNGVCQSSNENLRFGEMLSSLSTSESPAEYSEYLPEDVGEKGRVEDDGEKGSY